MKAKSGEVGTEEAVPQFEYLFVPVLTAVESLLSEKKTK
jgi:hypothetical protein